MSAPRHMWLRSIDRLIIKRNDIIPSLLKAYIWGDIASILVYRTHGGWISFLFWQMIAFELFRISLRTPKVSLKEKIATR